MRYKINMLNRFLFLFTFFTIFQLNTPIWAIDLKLKDTLKLTEEGRQELRPEIHIVEKDGKKHVFIALRKKMTPFLMREFFFETKKQSKDIILFPQTEKSVGITDFGSCFVNGTLYFVAQFTDRDTGGLRFRQRVNSLVLERQFRDEAQTNRMVDGEGDWGKLSENGRKMVRAKQIVKLVLLKFDQNFKIIKSVLVAEEDAMKKDSLVTGGPEVDSLIIEQGDDPGVVSDGKNIYVITEIRKRGAFREDEAQYRVHIYDLDLNPLEYKDINAGRFNGGFQKLVYPIYYQGKFWLLGEFIPPGYYDPDLPPWQRRGQLNRANKDLFVMQYNNDWEPIGNGWQLTSTYPGIEYYATGFLPYKDYFFAAYSYASDISLKNSRGMLGDGDMRLSIFDRDFKLVKEIEVSEKVCTQGNLAVFDNYLFMVYVEKEILPMSPGERKQGGLRGTRNDLILKIYKID